MGGRANEPPDRDVWMHLKTAYEKRRRITDQFLTSFSYFAGTIVAAWRSNVTTYIHSYIHSSIPIHFVGIIGAAWRSNGTECIHSFIHFAGIIGATWRPNAAAATRNLLFHKLVDAILVETVKGFQSSQVQRKLDWGMRWQV